MKQPSHDFLALSHERKHVMAFGDLPPASDVIEIHEWTFTGRLRGAIGLATLIVRVRFEATPGTASDAAWQALLASGAYDLGEHFVPTIRARLGRKADAHSGAYANALEAARSFMAGGMTAALATDIIARHWPERLTALEVATLDLAVRGAKSCPF